MDPLTAFGLAASIVQFVAFATRLVAKSTEFYDASSSGGGEGGAAALGSIGP